VSGVVVTVGLQAPAIYDNTLAVSVNTVEVITNSIGYWEVALLDTESMKNSSLYYITLLGTSYDRKHVIALPKEKQAYNITELI